MQNPINIFRQIARHFDFCADCIAHGRFRTFNFTRQSGFFPSVHENEKVDIG